MPFLTIAFPVFNPIALQIGPIAIRWYALAYICGIVLGWIYARSLVKKERLWGGLTMGMLLSVPMVIAGAVMIVLAWRRKSPKDQPTPAESRS